MKIKVIRPMLACSRNVTLDDLQSLQMPLYASIKQDGIRCRLDMSGTGILHPMSRALKELPNMYIRQWAQDQGIIGLDGEIVIPGWTFNDIQSWVMTAYPMRLEPFEFRVFDYFSEEIFFNRIVKAAHLVDGTSHPRIRMVHQIQIHTPLQLRKLYERTIKDGEEGLILRSLNGLYKSGRSTWNQAYSLKMKDFEDDEAIIVGYYPWEENQNESIINELGLKKKSSHKKNKIHLKMLGGFIVEHPIFGRFNVGSGFTKQQRIDYWLIAKKLCGHEITFKFQRPGMKDKPRTPIFKSLNTTLQYVTRTHILR